MNDVGHNVAVLDLLGRVPLFGCIAPQELESLAARFVETAYKKGDTVCRRGDEGDTFFVVESGELEIWGGPNDAELINRLGPGEFLGEMSLLTGTKRSATVTAAKSSRLLALSRASFDEFFLGNAKALEYFSKILCKRLATLARGGSVARTATVICVSGPPALKGKTLVATTLAGLLKDLSQREVLLVSIAGRKNGRRQATRPLLSDVSAAPAADIAGHVLTRNSNTPSLALQLAPEDAAGCSASLSALITKLADRFAVLVLDLGAEAEALVRVGEELSDHVIRIVERCAAERPTGKRGASQPFEVMNLYNPASAAVPINHCEPFVLPADRSLHNLDASSQAERIRQRPWSPIGAPLHRLARKLLGASVGIALGGGAAFGVAHVGVFKVLEDHQIPIDLVAGCSMGSIVAIGYAAGLRAADMIDIASRIGNKWTTLSALDVSFTKPGFLAGNRLIKIFGPLLGPLQTFEQLRLPCTTVATDIETGERVLIGSGRLDAAFRASCSVPMLWSPVRHDGRVLVDGGVVDPVPAEVVNEMGADICIAVNAVPPLKKGVDTILSRVSKLVKRFDPLSYLSGAQGMPNMFDITMNSIQMLQYELGNFKAIAADVRINMDLSDYTWIEFYRAKELIERGAEAAERAVPQIKRVLAERLAQ